MQDDHNARHYVGILLAAGKGVRFDSSGEQNKLLQPLPGGDTVIAAAAKNLLSALPRVLAVVHPHAHAVAASLQALGCEVKVCPEADLGMGVSLVHAIAGTADAAGWLVALGDMPFIRPATMQALIDALEQGGDIAAPRYQGHRGNPVAFSRKHLPDLLKLGGDQGARRLLRKYPVVDVTVDDRGVTMDIDTRSDLQAPR